MGVEQYRELFVTESEEHLQLLNDAVLELEKDPANTEVLNKIFRSAHTLKGMAATMGYESLTRLTHRMEDLLDVFRKQKMPVNSEVVDILFKCLDALEMLIEEIKTQKELNIDIDSVIMQLESVIPRLFSAPADGLLGKDAKEVALTVLEKDNLVKLAREQNFKIYKLKIYLSSDCQLKSVRVYMVFQKLETLGEVIKTQPSVDDLEQNKFGRLFSLIFITKTPKNKIEDVLRNILEIEEVKMEAVTNVDEISKEDEVKEEEFSQQISPAMKEDDGRLKDVMQLGLKKIQSVRVTTKRLDKLMNVVGELVIAKIRLIQIAQSQRLQQVSEILTNIDRLTGELQDEVMQARLIPIAQVFDRFPRMVRDLARSEGKQINLAITGGEIELDRTVLDEIADPLVHLLRNSVDHGIEIPQERKKAGKNPVGTIKLSALRERTFVLIEVSDDGRGIDTNMLREIALKKGFLTAEEAEKLSKREVLDLILLPGFSSASVVTDTSGRGVGMDVVKMKIESLGGSLFFDSEVGKGSNFDLKLPLTVAIIRAMLVSVNEEIYATPIANIVETVKIRKDKIKRIEKFEVINLRGEVLALLRLKQILGSMDRKDKNSETEKEEISIVVVEVSGKKAGLVVDKLLGQQEVVIKSIGSMLKTIKGFAGATILGDGRVALILDVATLVGYL